MPTFGCLDYLIFLGSLIVGAFLGALNELVQNNSLDHKRNGKK